MAYEKYWKGVWLCTLMEQVSITGKPFAVSVSL